MSFPSSYIKEVRIDQKMDFDLTDEIDQAHKNVRLLAKNSEN